jgi:hypothetical protein
MADISKLSAMDFGLSTLQTQKKGRKLTDPLACFFSSSRACGWGRGKRRPAHGGGWDERSSAVDRRVIL